MSITTLIPLIVVAALALLCIYRLLIDRVQARSATEIEAGTRKLAEKRLKAKKKSGKKGAGSDVLDVRGLSGFEATLARAGITMAPGSFAACVGVAAAAAAGLGTLAWGVAAGVSVALAVVGACWIWVSQKAKRRTQLFERQLATAELQIAENLKSGLSVARSIKSVSEQTENPLKAQLDGVYNEITYTSTTLPEALANMSMRTANKDVDLLATVIKVQDETGSDLSASLEALSETLTRRMQLRNNAKMALSEVKMTIKVCAVMPFVILIMVLNLYTGTVEFYQSQLGTMILVICAIVEAIALVVLTRMSDVKLD